MEITNGDNGQQSLGLQGLSAGKVIGKQVGGSKDDQIGETLNDFGQLLKNEIHKF